MRLVHVISRLDPSSGGPPVVAVRLGAAQSALGNDVTLLSHSEASDVVNGPLLEDVPGAAQLTIRRVSRLTQAPFSTWQTLRQTLEAADLVCIHGVWEPLLLSVAFLCRRADKPYTITPHGMLDTWSLRQKRLKKQLALTLIYKRMLDGACFIQALNTRQRDAMHPLQLRAPIRIIPNGVFAEDFQRLPNPGSFRAQHPELGDKPIVLFLSRLHHQKGLDYLIEAFKPIHSAAPDAQLVIVGPDDGTLSPARAQLRRLGLEQQAHFIGPLYGDAKLAALVDAQVFCLPSRHEGFSVAILEALSANLPVVVSEQCHFPEVQTSGAGIVVKLDKTSIAEAVLKILSTPNAKQVYGARGRELVTKHYIWAQIARLSIEYYQAALKPKTQPDD